jgi:hypothetical protein
MEKEVNRLARGLVREELRDLYKTSFLNDVDRMRSLIRSFKMAYAQRSGATPRQIEKMKKQMQGLFKQFYTFDTMAKSRYSPNHMGTVSVGAAFIWSVTQTAFEREGGEDISNHATYQYDSKFCGFTEQNLKLNFQRASVTPSSASIQNIYQRVALSDHMLYRLIDRGVCEKKPLAHFSDRIWEWLPYVNALMLVGNRNGFIPFDQGGLVIQTYNTEEPVEQTEENQGWRVYDRFDLRATGGRDYLTHLESPSLVNYLHSSGDRDLLAWVDYRITTYLTEHQMTSNRMWAVMQFKKLMEDFPDEYVQLTHMNTPLSSKPDVMKTFADPHSDFLRAVKKLTMNPRYIDACRGAS